MQNGEYTIFIRYLLVPYAGHLLVGGFTPLQIPSRQDSERIERRIPLARNMQIFFYKQSVHGNDTKIEKGLLDG